MDFSYECTNVSSLQQYVYQGIDTAEMPLMLKNTGLSPWPPNSTKIIFDKNYEIKGKDVELNSL